MSFPFSFIFFLILQMSGVQELLLRRLPDEQPGECLTSHAVCIPQTLISDISGAVNDGRVSSFFPPFCSRHVNHLNQAAPAIVSHPTNLMPTKMPRGSEGQTGGAHCGLLTRGELQLHFLNKKVKKTRKHLETSQKDAALLIYLCSLSPTSQRKQQLLALVTSVSESLCFPLLQGLIYRGTIAFPSAPLLS